MENFRDLEKRLNDESSKNDSIMFQGLSALIIVLAIFIAANAVAPKAGLREFAYATIVSIVWFITRQELMIHRSDGYLALWRKVLKIEETQNISDNTVRVRPLDWDEWRNDTWFRFLMLIVSDVLSGCVGFVWIFRTLFPYPSGSKLLTWVLATLLVTGIIMIPVTIVYAKKDPTIKFTR